MYDPIQIHKNHYNDLGYALGNHVDSYDIETCWDCIMYDYSYKGDTDVITFIGNKYIDLNHCMCCASSGGHIDLVKLIIEKGTLTGCLFDWNRGMVCAARDGHIDIVQLMIENNTQDTKLWGKVILDWNEGIENASRGGYLDIIKLMIEKGTEKANRLMINIEHFIEFGRGMAYSSRGGHIELVKFFIEKGKEDLVQSKKRGKNLKDILNWDWSL